MPRRVSIKKAALRPAKALKQAVKSIASAITAKSRKKVATKKTARAAARPQTASRPVAKTTSRAPKRQTDIPMDQLAAAYIPTQTSLKTGFRTSGADQERDQEFAGGVADNRFNDEDRFTNKSGDPRIGTHGRTYEPGEARTTKSTRGRK